MKKISLIALGLTATLAVSAQPDVVKNVEGLVKSKNYTEALQAVKPAMTNSETMNTVQPWYLAGKAGIGYWDEVSLVNIQQKATPEQLTAASQALVDAYANLVKALPLDSLPDAKGKVKPKYSKEIKKLIGENYHNYLTAGLNLYNAQNYPAAYDAWDIYVNLPQNAAADQKSFVADPDSTVGEIAYYQSLAAFFDKKFDKALTQVDKALAKGYKSKNAYLVGLEAATNLGKEDVANKFAREGNKNYGSDDISFLAASISGPLNSGNYPACYEAVDESFAIAANDSIKSQLYNIKAIINERENKIAEAKENLQKSIDLFPTNAKSYFDMGRLIQNEVAAQEDSADDATRTNVLVPALKKAIEFYEKSYELDNSQNELPGHIYRLYYNLDQNYHLGPDYAAKAEYWKNL